jgi:hypothetical protein
VLEEGRGRRKRPLIAADGIAESPGVVALISVFGTIIVGMLGFIANRMRDRASASIEREKVDDVGLAQAAEKAFELAEQLRVEADRARERETAAKEREDECLRRVRKVEEERDQMETRLLRRIARLEDRLNDGGL